MKKEWFEYNRESNNYFLTSFIQDYDYSDPEEFFVYISDNDVSYVCTIVQSNNFKGLAYIKAKSLSTDETVHFAVGDDRITHWKPVNNKPSLMVG